MTGWKGVFVNRGFTRRIQGVTKDESDVLLQYLFNVSIHGIASQNHAQIADPNAASHTKPRCASAVQVEEERPRNLGQPINQPLRDV